MIKNPCIQICRYDDDGKCIGCKRTMKEATRWIFLSEDEKKEILINIEQRKKQTKPGTESFDFYV